jgi:TRAP transporter TAXI family solute receptor
MERVQLLNKHDEPREEPMTTLVPRTIAKFIGAASVASAALAFSTGPAAAQAVALATDAIGGITHTIGSAVAKIATQNSDLNVRIRAYGGPEIWMPQLDEGRISFGAHFAATTWLSFNKIDTKVKTDNIRLVRAGAATVPLGFMVRKDSDIQTVADLKGRRVAGGYGAHPIMKRLSEGVMKAYGIETSDVNIVPVPAAGDGAGAIRDGRAEAAWFAVFAPISREINSKVGIRFLPIDWTPERLKIARDAIFPGVVPVTVPVNLPFAPKGTSLLGYEFYIIAGTKTDDALVTKLLEALWDNEKELTKVHANLRGFRNKAAVSEVPVIPYHDAAIAFYKKKGVWTDAADKMMKKN